MAMRVAVLMGGVSSEREISLLSGRAIAKALAQRGYEVMAVDVRSENLEQCLAGTSPDAVFIALHGRFGEDGKVQAQCEALGVPYTGSRPEASALALDKVLAKQIFARAGIRTPAFAVVRGTGPDDMRALRALGLPLVVKPPLEGSSIGLSIVTEETQIVPAVQAALGYGPQALAEAFITGKELTVGVLGDCALPIVQIVPRSGVYDYRSKYEKGQTEYLVPAPLDEQTAVSVQQLALEAFGALHCEDFGRVDIMLSSGNEAFVLEVNTIPGFTETSLLPKAARAAGMDFEDLCKEILTMGIKKMQVLQ